MGFGALCDWKVSIWRRSNRIDVSVNNLLLLVQILNRTFYVCIHSKFTMQIVLCELLIVDMRMDVGTVHWMGCISNSIWKILKFIKSNDLQYDCRFVNWNAIMNLNRIIFFIPKNCSKQIIAMNLNWMRHCKATSIQFITKAGCICVKNGNWKFRWKPLSINWLISFICSAWSGFIRIEIDEKWENR